MNTCAKIYPMQRYNDYFIDIELSPRTAYVYSVRKLLQKAIDKGAPLFSGTLLDLGCGDMPYRQYLLDKNDRIKKYVGVDVEFSQYHSDAKPDIVWDGKRIPVKDKAIDTVMATELFEHVSNLGEILSEINRVLVEKGLLFFTVPFIWPLHEVPNDQYRYTPYSLRSAMEKAGFRDIVIVPLGGYNASLAQMMCIWMYNRRNEPASRLKQRMLGLAERCILYPIIKRLLEKDEANQVAAYGENTMPTGFYGHAKK